MEYINILKKDILELILPELLAHAEKCYLKNSEYQKASIQVDLIYEKLSESLNDDEIAEELEEYFTANNALIALQDKLMYQQGMSDLLNLILSLLQRN